LTNSIVGLPGVKTHGSFNQTIHSEAGEIKLKKVFDNISLTRNDIKLRNLQHTLPHIILPTNRILVMIGINESVQ
jgi:hypothetical protein